MVERFRTNWWRGSVRSSYGYFVRIKQRDVLLYRDSVCEFELFATWQFRGLRADVISLHESEVPEFAHLSRAELVDRIVRALKAAHWRVEVYPEDNGPPYVV